MATVHVGKGAVAQQICIAEQANPETRKILEKMDTDKSGYISLTELSQFMRTLATVQTQNKPGRIPLSSFSAENRKALEVFDNDGSGEIDTVELQYAGQLYLKEKQKAKRYLKLVLLLVTMITISLGINMALSFIVVDLSKDTKVDNGKLEDRKTGEMLATGAYVLPHKPDFPTEASAQRHRSLLQTDGDEDVVFQEFAFNTAADACKAMCKGSLDLLVDTENSQGQTMEPFHIVRREGCTCASGAATVVNDELTATVEDKYKQTYTVLCHGGTTCTVSTSADNYYNLQVEENALNQRRRGRSLQTSDASETSLQTRHALQTALDHNKCPEMCMYGNCQQSPNYLTQATRANTGNLGQDYEAITHAFGETFCKWQCRRDGYSPGTGNYVCRGSYRKSAIHDDVDCDGCFQHLRNVAWVPPATPGCFPADATVVLEDGHKTVPIHEVKVGDRVLSVDATGAAVFSDVWYPGHADRTGMFDYLQMKTEAGAVIELSHGHYIPTIPSEPTPRTAAHEYASAVTIQARSVRVGDVVFQTRADSKTVGHRIVEINEVRREGLYNPMVLEGTLVVDGVVASAYAKWCFEYVIPPWMVGYNESAYAAIQHAWFAPMRAVYKAMGAKWVQDLVVNMSHGDLYYGDSFARNLFSFWQPYWMVVRAFALQYLPLKT